MDFGTTVQDNATGQELSSESLNVLLSYPLFWPSSEIMNFIRDACNCTKDDNSPHIIQFKRNVDTDPNAIDAIHINWTGMLNPKHLEILQREGSLSKNAHRKRVRNSSGNSSMELLRLIRNKGEHYPELGEEERNVFGWYSHGSFDVHKFVVYWTNIFPTYIPEMWLQFSKLKDREAILEKYYPPQFTLPAQNIFGFENFVRKLRHALDEHQWIGGMIKRYACHATTNNSAPVILEFRTLPHGLLNFMTVNNNATFKIEIQTAQYISSSWIDHSKDQENTFIYEAYLPKGENLLLIFIHCDTDEVKMKQNTEGDIPSRVVVFTGYSHETSCVDTLAKKFCKSNNFAIKDEITLRWEELPERRQSEIVAKGCVFFQNKEYHLKNILPIVNQNKDGNSERELVLNCLQGTFLNDLCRDKIPIIYSQVDIPKKDVEFYVERRIISRSCNVTSKILRHPSKDKLLCIGASLQKLKTLAKTELIGSFDNCQFQNGDETDIPRIYLGEVTDFKSLCITFPKNNVHLLKYHGEDSEGTFKWVKSHGSVGLVQKSLKKKAEEFSAMTEREFLNVLEWLLCSLDNNENAPICIGDKPGMGKSLLLSSLAAAVRDKIPNRFILFSTMSNFIRCIPKENLEQKIISKQVVSEIIIDLASNTNFEKCLIKAWLEGCGDIKCEVMLDAVDEVPTKYKDVVKTVLKIIRNDFRDIRLWITLRDYMLDDVEELLGTLGYKILPFEETDQIDYLQNHWQSKLRLEEGEFDKTTLKKFASECILSISHVDKSVFEDEIAGVPLQSRMLAEIYEESARKIIINSKSILNLETHKLTRELKSNSLTKLYGKMLEKKFEEYLRRKKQLSNINMEDDFLSGFRKDMNDRHIQMAIKMLFGDDRVDSLFEKCDNLDRICEYGIVQNYSPVVFIHRTFAEYFVALYVFEVVSGKRTSCDVEIFCNFVLENVLEVIPEQFSHDPVTSTSSNGSTFRFPVVCFFLNYLLSTLPENFQANHALLRLSCKTRDFKSDQIFRPSESVIIAAIRNDSLNIFCVLINSLNESERNDFLTQIKSHHNCIMDSAVRFTSLHFFKCICTLLENWSKSNSKEYEIPNEILYTAARRGRYEILKFLVTEKGFGPETWTSLRENDSNNLAHYCIRRSKNNKKSVLDEKQRILQFLTECNPSILEEKDSQGRTPLLLQLDASMILKECLVNLGANTNATGKWGNSSLHWYEHAKFAAAVSPLKYHVMLKLFVENNFQINLCDNKGNVPIHCAVKTYFDELLDETLNLFQERGANFNILDENGQAILHLAIERDSSLNFIEKLISCGSSILFKNTNGQSALHVAVGKGNLLLTKILVEKYKADIYSCDNESRSVLNYIDLVKSEERRIEISNYLESVK